MAHAPGAKKARRALKAELLDSILSCGQLCRHDAAGREHGEAAVVQLALPHLLVVHAEAQRVAEVSGLLVWALLPEDELHNATSEHQDRGPVGDRELSHGGDAILHLRSVDAQEREVLEVLEHEAYAREHRHAAVLELPH